MSPEVCAVPVAPLLTLKILSESKRFRTESISVPIPIVVPDPTLLPMDET